jgi:flagellar hook protein FlgE
VSFAVTTGATTPVPLTLDYSGSTQFGSNFSVNSLSQDGFTSGSLSGFNTGADGTIIGRYTNGQSKTLGQVALASFVNPNGLQSLGGNAWVESATSGAALVGQPNTGKLGVLQSSATEDSNVDLTAELVNMITAQRVYQANAQTIKTEDQMLQTLVNLR